MSYRCNACEETGISTPLCDRCSFQINAFRSYYNLYNKIGVDHIEAFGRAIAETSDCRVDALVNQYGAKNLLQDLRSFQKVTASWYKYKDSDNKKPFFDLAMVEIGKIKSPEIKYRLVKMFKKG
jgi:hypothetical protein